ncbi:MAG: hypothetical protein WCI63_03215 [bacterium]
MKVSFYISKIANHFFFVQNLSEWHFSCRKSYNKEWLEITGPLKENEIEALASLRRLLSKYSFKPLKQAPSLNIFEYFIRFEELKTNNTIFDEKEYEIYFSAMDIFRHRFEQIWGEDSVKLEKIRGLLEKEFSKEKENVLNDLKILFKSKVKVNDDYTVYLFISTGPYGGGGGANIGPRKVSLECSSTKKEFINHKLAILWHEITHKILKSYIDEYKKEFIKNNKSIKLKDVIKKSDFDYLSELLTYSLFTDASALTEKYFPTKISSRLSQIVKDDDSEKITKSNFTFPMLLIYYNGQSIINMINKKSYVSPEEMSKIIYNNQKKVEKYFIDHDKEVIWTS